MTIFTYLIIGVNILVTVIGFNNHRLIKQFDFSIFDITRKKELFRIFTSQFFHVNWAHLLFNMFSFYSFSTNIEYKFGTAVTAIIYFTSAVSGDLFALFANRKNLQYRAIGASGAVSGIIFSSIFLVPGGSIIIFPIPIPMPSWLFAFLFIIISIFAIGRGESNIGHEAHLGGALCGTVISILILPEILYNNTLLLTGVVVPVLFFILFLKKFKK
jgi:membrane associated rhomboid family serine protease